jgi:hypothetical protein
MELSDSGSMEEQELVTQMSPKQRLIQLQNLRHIASRLSKINPAQLNALIWQIVIGEQVWKKLMGKYHFPSYFY